MEHYLIGFQQDVRGAYDWERAREEPRYQEHEPEPQPNKKVVRGLVKRSPRRRKK